MPRTEVLTTFRIRLFDRHVRIAEANDDNLTSRILDVDSTLLPFSRSVERLVERHLLALIGITFFGKGGFHGRTFSASTACLYSSEFFPNSCLIEDDT
mgnify:CR=1 FL=1